MPPKKLKTVNVTIRHHKLAQAIADHLTEHNRKVTGDPTLREKPIQAVVQAAIELYAASLGIRLED